MDFGKLSDTFRNLAGHLEATGGKVVGMEELALKVTTMFVGVLHGFATMLEASPVTIPAPVIAPPAPKA